MLLVGVRVFPYLYSQAHFTTALLTDPSRVSPTIRALKAAIVVVPLRMAMEEELVMLLMVMLRR
jgi:hypothetical protein